jgi:hypothetical protein
VSVPRVLAVVVLSAAVGPRNPNTLPYPTWKDTSSNAARPLKRLLRPSTTTAGWALGPVDRWASTPSVPRMTGASSCVAFCGPRLIGSGPGSELSRSSPAPLIYVL